MQLNLSFLEIPGPTQQLWESLDHEQRQAVIEMLSRLIATTALATEPNEENNDD